MKNIWKGHCKGYRRIRLFATIYIKTYQLVDGKTWNSASSGKRTKVGRMTRYSETPQHKWRYRRNMTLRNILLHFEFSNKTLDLKCVTLSIISTWGSFVEMKRICHLHISHNTPCLLPNREVYYHINNHINFVFDFVWVLQLSQEKLKTMLTQNFWGKQGALWEMCNWRPPNFAPRFSSLAAAGSTENRTDSLFLLSPYCETRRLWEEVAKSSCHN